MEADANVHFDTLRASKFARVPPHGVLHLESRVAGTHRVILVGDRRPEQRHDPVAHHLVHCAFVAVDRFHHVFK